MQESIFIGYRRDDTGGDAGRMFDRLEQAVGRARIFKDVDSMARGVKFREYIPSVVSQCGVFLALIGRNWLDVRDGSGNRRLNDPEDLVRIEIETALSLPQIRLIPVLVAGASMPSDRDLPPSLRPITELNAAHVRHDPDFHSDMSRLILDLNINEKPEGSKQSAASPATVSSEGWVYQDNYAPLI